MSKAECAWHKKTCSIAIELEQDDLKHNDIGKVFDGVTLSS